MTLSEWGYVVYKAVQHWPLDAKLELFAAGRSLATKAPSLRANRGCESQEIELGRPPDGTALPRKWVLHGTRSEQRSIFGAKGRRELRNKQNRITGHR